MLYLLYIRVIQNYLLNISLFVYSVCISVLTELRLGPCTRKCGCTIQGQHAMMQTLSCTG